MSLLDKARAIKTRKPRVVTEEERELALGWAKDEVTVTQVKELLNDKGTGNVYIFLALALKSYIQHQKKTGE